MYIGHHLNTKYGLVSTVSYAETIGANFFQIFLASPHQYNPKRPSKDDLKMLSQRLKIKNMKMVIHANFMLNFCNPPNSFKHMQATKLLINDLIDSSVAGAIGVVIHMGKRLDMDENEAINNYVVGIKYVLNNTPKDTTIIFETGAGQGTEVATSIFGLRDLYDRFTEEEQRRIKFCIDTCHIFAAGYDMSDIGFCSVFCNLVRDVLGWENIACVHLNDSKFGLNCRKDRHADIGRGFIKIPGLKKFVRMCCKKNVPVVLETPCEDGFKREQQIALVRSWVD